MKTTAKLRSLSESVRVRANGSLRSRTALWAGIATGAGLVAGMAGRLLRRRLRGRGMPAIIVIEGVC